MNLSLKRLTVLVPRDLEATVLEALLDMQPAIPGFTTLAVSGHGERFEGTRVQEQVRGRIERSMTWLVLPEADVERVLTELRRHISSPDVVWWIEPVDAMGRLA
jgi:nitrogen regulatory protein PII